LQVRIDEPLHNDFIKPFDGLAEYLRLGQLWLWWLEFFFFFIFFHEIRSRDWIIFEYLRFNFVAEIEVLLSVFDWMVGWCGSVDDVINFSGLAKLNEMKVHFVVTADTQSLPH
jgi:hypothetical protein